MMAIAGAGDRRSVDFVGPPPTHFQAYQTGRSATHRPLNPCCRSPAFAGSEVHEMVGTYGGRNGRQAILNSAAEETRYESITYRSRMEAALETAMPGYIFTVTIEHPQLHNDTALRHPKYIMNC